jgi:hypothetical protein
MGLAGCAAAPATAPAPPAPLNQTTGVAPATDWLTDGTVVATVSGHPLTGPELAQVADLMSLDQAPGQTDQLIRAGVRIKAIQLEAWRRGLIASVDFTDLVAELELVNQSHRDTAQAGGVVYGVSRFDLATHFARSVSAARTALWNDLAANGQLEPSPAQLTALYQRQFDQVAAQPDSISLDLIRLPATAAGLAAAQALLEDLAAGVTVEQALAAQPGLVWEATVLEVTPESAYELAKYRPALHSAATALRPGQVTSLSDDLAGGLILLRCRHRQSNPPLPLAQVIDQVRGLAQDELFERLIDELVAASPVVRFDR